MNRPILVNRLSKLPIIQGSLIFILSVLLAALSLESVVAVLLLMSMGSVGLGLSLYFTFISTPHTVEFIDDSLVLTSYAHTKRTVRLEDIEYLVVNALDPPQWRKKFVVGGRARILHGRVFVFTREIGEAIRAAYFEKTGRYAPGQPASAILNRKLR